MLLFQFLFYDIGFFLVYVISLSHTIENFDHTPKVVILKGSKFAIGQQLNLVFFEENRSLLLNQLINAKYLYWYFESKNQYDFFGVLILRFEYIDTSIGSYPGCFTHFSIKDFTSYCLANNNTSTLNSSFLISSFSNETF